MEPLVFWSLWITIGIFTIGVIHETLYTYIYKHSLFEDTAQCGSVLCTILTILIGPMTWVFIFGSWLSQKLKALTAQKNLKDLETISENVKFLIEHKDELKEIEEFLSQMS